MHPVTQHLSSLRTNLHSGIFLLIKLRFINHEMDRAAMTSQRDLLLEYVAAAAAAVAAAAAAAAQA